MQTDQESDQVLLKWNAK